MARGRRRSLSPAICAIKIRHNSRINRGQPQLFALLVYIIQAKCPAHLYPPLIQLSQHVKQIWHKRNERKCLAELCAVNGCEETLHVRRDLSPSQHRYHHPHLLLIRQGSFETSWANELPTASIQVKTFYKAYDSALMESSFVFIKLKLKIDSAASTGGQGTLTYSCNSLGLRLRQHCRFQSCVCY